MEIRHVTSLNPEQRAAVEHFEGPILVLAGAGSGKTRVLTTRIARLIHEHGVDPSSILAVTFTNKAAGEMRERVRRILGRDPAGMWMGTFHSLGARLLRRHANALGWSPNFTINDSDQTLREIKRTLTRLNIDPKKWHPQAVASAISTAKNQLIGPDEYKALAADMFSRVVADAYPDYLRSLREQNAFDFDDLLIKPVELFRTHEKILESYQRRFNFILVDEYQDTNRAQYVWLHLLAQGHHNLMVVGDDDQSIYGWRGADIKNILDFEKDFPDTVTVRLEQNYRSTGRILDAANAVISQNRQRKGKTLRTDAGPGDRLVELEAADERDEADWIGGEIQARMSVEPDLTPRDFTVLYRTNSQSRALEENFLRRNLPYQIIGGTRFYERREIMDVLAYLRLISNPRDAGAFDRIVNYPRRGIGDTTKAHVLEFASARGISALDASLIADQIDAIRGGATGSLRNFAAMIQKYTALAAHVGVGELTSKLVEEIKILDALRDEGPEGEERMENVRELVSSTHDFDARRGDMADDSEPEDATGTALDMFLQKVSLLTDVDRHDPDVQAVTLMTLHNAKGLEFPFVFISGLEDGLFPLARAFDEPATLEEERRLFYVGITRGERRVYMTWARMRRRMGEMTVSKKSSFVDPIPEELVEQRSTPAVVRNRRDYGGGWRSSGGMGGMGGSGRSNFGSASSSNYGTGGGARAPRRQPKFEGSDDGVYIDYSDSQDAPLYVKGERVRHPQFGGGTILELSGFGNDLKAVIDFDKTGRKKVVLRYANLQKEL
jgi:DNA helicase-2/ATP-dependent DNA helicase PcrA